jgi:hypothetical protein
MRGGTIIGIPITLLQLAVHSKTGAHVDPILVANNFALCNAIYSADRLTCGVWDAQRIPSRISAIASTAFLASDPHTASLALLVPPLHTSYTDVKPIIAPVKPFFVSLMWTILVYFLPVWRSGSGDVDFMQCGAFFLSIAALSHAADVVDLQEDEAAGLETPAVAMTDVSGSYAYGLAFAAAFLDASSQHPVPLYDLLVLIALGGIVADQMACATVLGISCTIAYTVLHDFELFRWILQSSEATHRIAIHSTLDIVDTAMKLPDPWRMMIIDVTFRVVEHGDAVGHTILKLYERAVRSELL